MTRFDFLILAAILALFATASRPSGLSAPELSERPVGMMISGRLYVPEPGSLISIGGTGIAGLGAWDHPAGVVAHSGPKVSDNPPPVPLPAPGLLMVGAIGAWIAMRKVTG